MSDVYINSNQHEKLARFAKWNGGSIFIFGIIGGVVGLLSVSFEGILMGVLIAGAGWIELQGKNKLLQGETDAGRWLMGGEGLLLFVILVYAFAHLIPLNPDHVLDILSPEMRSFLTETGGFPSHMINDLVYTILKWLYQGLIIGTVLYQGGIIAFYYFKTRDI